MKPRFEILWLAAVASLGGRLAGAAPNPAAVHCEKLKGKVEVYQDQDVQAAFCRLPDNSLIHADSLRSASTGKPDEAVKAFLKQEPPAWDGTGARAERAYCMQLHGGVFEMKSAAGTATICRFAYRSAIETKTLLDGPKKRLKLAAALRKRAS